MAYAYAVVSWPRVKVQARSLIAGEGPQFHRSDMKRPNA